MMRMSVRTYTTLITTILLSAVIISASTMFLSIQHKELGEEFIRRMHMELDMFADQVRNPLQEGQYSALAEVCKPMVQTQMVESVDIANRHGNIVERCNPAHGEKLGLAHRLNGQGHNVQLVNNHCVGTQAVRDKQGQIVGYMRLTSSAEPLTKALAESRKTITAFGFGAIIAGTLLAFVLGGLLTSAFSPLLSALRTTISGNFSASVPQGRLYEAEQMGSAFNQMIESLEKRTKDMEAINRLALGLALAIDLHETVQQAGATCKQITGGDCLIWIKNHINGRMEPMLGTAEPLFPAKTAIVARAIEENRTLTIGAQNADFPSGSQVTPDFCPNAAIIVPLIAAGYGSVGILAASLPLDMDIPQREHIASTVAIANIVAPVIAALQRTQARERAAQMLSEILRPPPPPNVPGMDIATRFYPAEVASGLGGDYYDFLRLDDRAWGIVVGDVAGKGLEAAQYTGMAKYAVRSYALEHLSPAKTLSLANTALTAQTSAELFITLFYMVIDIDAELIRFTCAGHPPGLHYQVKTDTCTLLEDGGPAVGIYNNMNYHETTVHVEPGDIIVLLTDGITEARRNGEMYELYRTASVVQENAQAPATDIADACINDVMKFTNGPLSDDLVLVAIKLV